MVYYAIEPPEPWGNIRGKPYITVSAKGISNGLSDIENDGADFGPDTPGTQTSGIQEAIDYAISAGNVSQYGHYGLWDFKRIKLLPGFFVINDNATIYFNNTTNNPTGIIFEGSSISEYVTVIAKLNSLSSPIISFSSPSGSSTGITATAMQFKNFAVWYYGSASNAASGVTVVNLSAQSEIGSAAMRFENLIIESSNPINNVMLDVSGYEDSVIDNVFTSNAGGSYNSNITQPSLKAYMSNGNVKIYNGQHSGIDIQAQMAILSGTVIGTGAGAGIIWRPTNNGSSLILDGVYFGGTLTRLITHQQTTWGASVNSNVIINGGLMSKTPVTNGDYMIDVPYGYHYYFFNGTTFFNNNSSDTLYLFNPTNFSNIRGVYGLSMYNAYPLMFNYVTINSISVSTPSVPASGTAVNNTYSIPIEVYLNGGTVTQVTRTSGGTNYTVFSNSTGASLNGLTIRLEPGDSITLTYTAAPTWAWAPA